MAVSKLGASQELCVVASCLGIFVWFVCLFSSFGCTGPRSLGAGLSCLPAIIFQFAKFSNSNGEMKTD